MSTMYLTKDSAMGKRGDTISVPWSVGKLMIAAGEGRYPTEEDLRPKPKAGLVELPASTPSTPKAAKVERAAKPEPAPMPKDEPKSEPKADPKIEPMPAAQPIVQHAPTHPKKPKDL